MGCTWNDEYRSGLPYFVAAMQLERAICVGNWHFLMAALMASSYG